MASLFILFPALFLVVIILQRVFTGRAMMAAVKLFNEALRSENDGYFEEAQQGYFLALDIVKSKRFRSHTLENKIMEKLKVLNTVIAYSGKRAGE